MPTLNDVANGIYVGKYTCNRDEQIQAMELLRAAQRVIDGIEKQIKTSEECGTRDELWVCIREPYDAFRKLEGEP